MRFFSKKQKVQTPIKRRKQRTNTPKNRRKIDVDTQMLYGFMHPDRKCQSCKRPLEVSNPLKYCGYCYGLKVSFSG